MASLVDEASGITSVSESCDGSVMDDGRGFTTGGTDHVAPEFKSPSRREGKKTSHRLRPFPLPVPAVVAPLSLEDLDLEDTLKAEDSFLSTSSGGHSSGRGGGGGGGSGGGDSFLLESSSAGHGNLSSYSIAVNRGRLGESASHVHTRSRKHSMLQSVMSRLRSGTIISTGEEQDSLSLSSAKSLKRELLKHDDGAGLDTSDMFLTIMNRKYQKEGKRAKLLATLLTFSNTDVNQRAPSGMTALHCAMRDHDLESARVLVAFGANVNATNQDGKTPLDIVQPDLQEAVLTPSGSSHSLTFSSSSSPSPSSSSPSSPEHRQEQQQRSFRSTAGSNRKMSRVKCKEFLESVGALGSELAHRLSVVPTVQPFPEVPSSSPSLSRHKKHFEEVLDWEATITGRYSDLERNIHSRLQNNTRAGREAVLSPDTAISLAVQLQEMALFQKAGSRVLCLDGGGIRGLVQLEMLSQLEVKTGRRIVELFDWIIGTSTGGIIALGLVYAKKSLTQLRQLYFRMKDEVFGKVKGAVSFNTAGLERILKKEFTETRCMDDEVYPRVLISAVKKDHINLKLHFFNNCFNDEYCKHWPVWKVARYTCAAPVLFGEADEYVDGGLLANNPSDSGLSRIQSYYRSRKEKLPLSLVVSVGCGKYPFQALGNVDFLFVGGQGWSSLAGTSNLMALLSYALVEPSVADDNCKSRCQEQGVRYFRLNPRLEQVVASGETNLETLLAAILQTRKEMVNRKEFSDLVLCLHELSDASRRMHDHLNGEDSSDTSGTST